MRGRADSFNRALPAKRGLSLLEVLVASLILFFVSILTLSDFMSSLRTYSLSKIVTTALLLNQKMMEQSLYSLSPYGAVSTQGKFSGNFSSYAFEIDDSPQGTSQEALVTVQVSGPENISRQLLAAKFPQRFWGTAVDSSGNVYFPSQTGSKLTIYGSTSQSTSPAASMPPFLSGLAFDGSGNVWAGDAANKALWSYSPSAGTWSGPWMLPRGGIPSGVAVDSSQNIWLADELNGDLLKFVNGSFSSTIPLPSSGIPSGLALDPSSGNLWLGDSLNHLLLAYSPVTDSFASAPLPYFGEPAGIAVDIYGDVWVVDSRNNALWEYIYPSVTQLSGGEWLGPFPSSPNGFQAPRGVAVQGGYLYVADITTEWECAWNGSAWSCSAVPGSR